jgi:23S rRNA pseudouridine2605 synthase
MKDPEGRPSVRELLADVPARVYPVGRLDFNTSGVLVATNDGEFADALLHPRRTVPKTYVVKVLGQMEDADLDRWRRGVDLEDGKTLPAKVKLLRYEGDKTWLELTITEGRNQQVRRMGDATGFRVMRLARTSFAGVTSEGLAPGRWRYVSADELSDLKKQFGVPRRVVSPPLEAPGARAAHARPRPVRPAGGPPRRDERRRDGERSEHPQDRERRGPRDGGAREGEVLHPRYGGGSPARRDLGVREDWGGGVRRGSTAAFDETPPPRSELGGRGGRTRTTGTGGGIGAGDGSYRVRGRYGASSGQNERNEAKEEAKATSPARRSRPRADSRRRG